MKTHRATVSGNVHPAMAGGDSFCPACLSQGIPVPTGVLKSMLLKEHRGEAREGYRFCPGQNCPIAYFDHDKLIDVTELNKAITLKDPSPDTLVCYCLQVSRGSILAGVQNGSIKNSEDAKRVTKACTGKACHLVNPGGICCGDQLRDTVAAGLAAQNADASLIEYAQQEDPGSTCCGRTLEKVLCGEAEDGSCATECGI